MGVKPLKRDSNGNIAEMTTGDMIESGLTAPNTIFYDVACDSSVYVGAAVKMASGTAYNAQADTKANSNVIGIVEAKSSSILCDIRVAGISASVFVGLDETKEYYLSAVTAGLIANTIPTATGQVIVQVGLPYSSTELAVIRGQRTVRL